MQDHPENSAGQDPVLVLARKLLSAREAFDEADERGDTDATDALMERCHDLEERIAATQATSLRGVLVQVVILQCVVDNVSEPYDGLGKGLIKTALAALEQFAEVDRAALLGEHYGCGPVRQHTEAPTTGSTFWGEALHERLLKHGERIAVLEMQSERLRGDIDDLQEGRPRVVRVTGSEDNVLTFPDAPA